MYLLKVLTGNELKIFMIICYGVEGKTYKNIEKMLEFKLTYPTILKSVDRLAKKNIVQKTQEGREICLELQDPYDKYAKFLTEFTHKLRPIGPGQNAKMGSAHKDILQLIAFYGQIKNVPKEHMREWMRQQIGTLYTPARKIYNYTNDLGKAMDLITRAQNYFASKGFNTWSLQGALLNNIHLFLEAKDIPGKYSANTPVKKIFCAYMVLKEIKPEHFQDWELRHGDQATPHATYILKHFKNEWKDAVNYIEEEAKFLKEKKLEFNLKTLADRIPEWWLRKKETDGRR